MTLAGHGTDNVMYRLGDDLVLRLPQRASGADAIVKEAEWLALLGGSLPMEVPEPVYVGAPSDRFEAPWSVYRWIDGAHPDETTVTDWARFGEDLAGFVAALHAVDVGAEPVSEALTWYRGQPLADFAKDGLEIVDEIAELVRREGLNLDVDRLRAVWSVLAATPQVPSSPVLLHGDLKAANLLVRQGRLHGVIDFGTLSIGQPAAEHAAVWGVPPPARQAYRSALSLDDAAWALSLGWALLPSLTGLPYYWDSWPDFAQGCLERIRFVLDAAGV